MRRVLLSLLALAAPLSLRAQYDRAPSDRPRLVVFITVDQMRADYADRWASQLSGGLKRLATDRSEPANDITMLQRPRVAIDLQRETRLTGWHHVHGERCFSSSLL